MKKAKIVLSAVALFAVVGGAFAFKAAKFGAGSLWTVTSTTRTAPAGPVIGLCTFRNDIKTTDIGTALTTVYQTVTTTAGLTNTNVCALPTVSFTTTTLPGM